MQMFGTFFAPPGIIRPIQKVLFKETLNLHYYYVVRLLYTDFQVAAPMLSRVT